MYLLVFTFDSSRYACSGAGGIDEILQSMAVRVEVWRGSILGDTRTMNREVLGKLDRKCPRNQFSSLKLGYLQDGRTTRFW